MAEVRAATNSLETAWDALSEGRWPFARACFEEALAVKETPEALEGLAWAVIASTTSG